MVKMADVKAVCRTFIALFLILISCKSLTFGFSDGSMLSKGTAATRKIYCNRPPSRRGPLHFHHTCNGFCQPRSDFWKFYTLTVTNTTYWKDIVRVNISAKPESGKSVTGFSIYAIDESDHVAGSFVEDDTDVVVGSCNDVITITDETHAAFHKMANHSRKNISIQWQPDGYNHGRVKFVLYVVNKHSDVYFVESEWLTSRKHGGEVLDIVSSLNKVLSAIDIESFEKSFTYRSRKGYQLDLSDPFAPFAKTPSEIELVPADMPRSNKITNTVSSKTSQTVQSAVISEGKRNGSLNNNTVNLNDNMVYSVVAKNDSSNNSNPDNKNSSSGNFNNNNSGDININSGEINITSGGINKISNSSYINSIISSDDINNVSSRMKDEEAGNSFNIREFDNSNNTTPPSGLGASENYANVNTFTTGINTIPAPGLSISDITTPDDYARLSTPITGIDTTTAPGLNSTEVTTHDNYPKLSTSTTATNTRTPAEFTDSLTVTTSTSAYLTTASTYTAGSDRTTTFGTPDKVSNANINRSDFHL